MDDLLNQKPLDQLSPDTFYTNEAEAKMGLMGVYSSFVDEWHQYDFMSDNCYCHHSWQGSLEFSEWKQNSSSSRALSKWRIAYRTIGRVNKFLENVEKVPISDKTKNTMKGEARMIRGYFYADLVHFYGDVPLILEELPLDEAKVTRTPKEEVLKAATEDFDFAIAHLPEVAPEVGRATKGAAQAFKARMCLYNQQWGEAASLCKDIIDSNTYKLYADYGAVFDESNENNVEVIFDIQYIKNVRVQPWPTTGTSFTEWPTAGITLSAIDAFNMKTTGKPITDPTSGYNEQNPFEDRDPRMDATYVLPNAPFIGGAPYIPAAQDGELQTCFRPRKYADIDNPDRGNCAVNLILMRYADVLLMRAEALVETGETGSEVYDLINQVRQRPSVMMPKVEEAEGTNLSQEQLREIVRHERRVEFGMEFTRYSDMRRWQLESAVSDIWGFNKAKLSDPSSPATWSFERMKIATRAFDPKKGWLWPIPLEDIQNNENLTQNDGY
ncbi:RagB/SusD family nutrient uptake outer membrane protein [Parabacteroides sp. OttesenSCG-928-O15]|nr:RagB/SusD family nutrient uptake outer membrane protein [Parabacteroides sp. OttesenSCG-928-O15]